jgi:hypothetical protein
MRRGLGAGTAELIALQRLLRDRGEPGLWEEVRAEEPEGRQRERAPAAAGIAVADDQPR